MAACAYQAYCVGRGYAIRPSATDPPVTVLFEANQLGLHLGYARLGVGARSLLWPAG